MTQSAGESWLYRVRRARQAYQRHIKMCLICKASTEVNLELNADRIKQKLCDRGWKLYDAWMGVGK